MKTLLVLRHAKSSWEDDGLSDHQRPLSQRGKHDAPLMGTLLKKQELVPDLIISSSAKRAAKTAEAVAQSCGYENEVILTETLYASSPEDYVEVLNDLEFDYNRVMVVGHNPGLEELIEELTGEWVRMPTAALTQIELGIDQWADLELDESGDLKNIWTPRELY